MARPPDPARRGDVLLKAMNYLAEHGLANLSMRKLAAAMGTSTNAIFYQFGSRERLIEAALDAAREATLSILTEFRARTPTPSVADAIVHIWNWWLEDPHNLVYTRLRMEAMMAADDDLPPERRPVLLSFWIDYFADWIRQEKNCTKEQAEVESTLVMALLSGLVVDLQSTGDEPRIRQSLMAFLTMWSGVRH